MRGYLLPFCITLHSDTFNIIWDPTKLFHSVDLVHQNYLFHLIFHVTFAFLSLISFFYFELFEFLIIPSYLPPICRSQIHSFPNLKVQIYWYVYYFDSLIIIEILALFIYVLTSIIQSFIILIIKMFAIARILLFYF